MYIWEIAHINNNTKISSPKILTWY